MSLVGSESIWAVVPAAGIGSRMEAAIAKQYLKIGNKTILENTLNCLLASEQIKQVIVALNEKDNIWAGLPISRSERIATTVGGDTRAQSVLNGLIGLQNKAKDNDWVLVHDAARPCLSPQSLTKLISELQNDEVGGLLALPSKDTLKLASLIDGQCVVDKTVDRSTIWRALTPQMFRYGLLKNALNTALEQGLDITDEASAMEEQGYQPKLIIGEEQNIKITTQDDLLLVKSLLLDNKVKG